MLTIFIVCGCYYDYNVPFMQADTLFSPKNRFLKINELDENGACITLQNGFY